MHSVYLITNQANGKYYVGRTKTSLVHRLGQHLRDSRSVTSSTLMPLHRAMRNEARENFTIMPQIECATVEEANAIAGSASDVEL